MTLVNMVPKSFKSFRRRMRLRLEKTQRTRMGEFVNRFQPMATQMTL